MKWRRRLAIGVLGAGLSAVEARGQSEERFRINGYTSLEFEKQLESAENGAGDPNGSFDADLFDLVLNFYVSDKIRTAADFTWEHGAASEDGRGNVALEYGFIEYAVSDLLKVRAGKMFIPFGIYNEIHTAKPAFLSVKEPASTNKTERIVDGAYRFYPRWGAGVGAHGDGVIRGKNFNYDVLFSNGDQETTNPFEEDDNGAKAVSGRFRLELTEEIHVGNSFYYDRYADRGDSRQLTSDGLELQFTRGDFRLWAEVLLGWLAPQDGGRSVRQLGWYVQPSYTFSNGVTPYVRVERIDPSLDASDDEGSDLVLGVNVEFARGFALKTENNFFKGGRASSLAAFPGRSYNELKMALVLGF